MGFYNQLHADIQCPHCLAVHHGIIQFKFGQTRQLNYELGDTLVWGVNNIGRQGLANVQVYGILECDACPVCKTEDEFEFDIFIEKDKIMKITWMANSRDYLDGDGEGCYIERIKIV